MPTGDGAVTTSANGASAAGGRERLEHHDVIVDGAGISGVGTACRVRTECPDKSIAVLEARDAIGGTWDLFRYPGIRSDSDMFTLGYNFRPWQEARAIADGPSIRKYVSETAEAYGVDELIRFGHRVVQAEWSTPDARWILHIELAGGGTETLTCSYLAASTGYFDYESPYSPEFPGAERFSGPIVHPQLWPEDLEGEGKRIVVIGSGATAVTLVPAMAAEAEHVTLLQRSPTYVVTRPAVDPLAVALRKFLPARFVYPFMRWWNALLMVATFNLMRRFPNRARAFLRRWVEPEVPEGFDFDRHFSPRYDPWDQRLCLVPDSDLFLALGDGSASMVTDTIETFTERGIMLASGEELEADVIVTATGLNLQMFGGAEIVVDGESVDMAETVSYKGMMFSGIPNLVMTMGYTNASWTLKADLVSEYFCRLIHHLDATGLRQWTPQEPPPSVEREPFLDLKAGYVLRTIDILPKQGAKTPWRLRQNYPIDVLQLRHGDIVDEGIVFSNPSLPAGAEAPPTAVPAAA